MQISTLGFCLIAVAALSTAACSKRGTEEAAPAADEAAAPAPPPGPEAAAPRAAGAAPSSDETAGVQGAAAGAAPASASGAQVFQTYCVTCHGAAGKGDGPAAAGLNPKPAAFAANGFRLDPNGNGKKGELDDIKAVVRDGAAKYGGSPLMAPWPMLSAEQLQGVAEHVDSLGGG
jgi:hypothetical protein